MCNWTCRFELCTRCSSHHCQLPLNPREEESASLVFTRIMWRRRFSTLSWFCSVNVKQAKLFFNNDLSLWWCHPLTWLCLHNITNYIYNYINYYIIIVINCRHVSKELKLFIIRVGTAGNISLYFPVSGENMELRAVIRARFKSLCFLHADSTQQSQFLRFKAFLSFFHQ